MDFTDLDAKNINLTFSDFKNKGSNTKLKIKHLSRYYLENATKTQSCWNNNTFFTLKKEAMVQERFETPCDKNNRKHVFWRFKTI